MVLGNTKMGTACLWLQDLLRSPHGLQFLASDLGYLPGFATATLNPQLVAGKAPGPRPAASIPAAPPLRRELAQLESLSGNAPVSSPAEEAPNTPVGTRFRFHCVHTHTGRQVAVPSQWLPPSDARPPHSCSPREKAAEVVAKLGQRLGRWPGSLGLQQSPAHGGCQGPGSDAAPGQDPSLPREWPRLSRSAQDAQ